MHGVGRTREVEDQLVARSKDLGVGHALLRATQAGVGPPHPSELTNLKSPSSAPNSSARSFRAAVSISPGTVSLAGCVGELNWGMGVLGSVVAAVVVDS